MGISLSATMTPAFGQFLEHLWAISWIHAILSLLQTEIQAQGKHKKHIEKLHDFSHFFIKIPKCLADFEHFFFQNYISDVIFCIYMTQPVCHVPAPFIVVVALLKML